MLGYFFRIPFKIKVIKSSNYFLKYLFYNLRKNNFLAYHIFLNIL
jgi:hypothetical protein